MPRLILIVFIVSVSVQCKGQSRAEFILAGQDTGLMYTNFSYPSWMFYTDHYAGGTFDVDINNDGLIDVQLQFVSDLNPANDGLTYFSISPNHSGIQFIGSYETIETCFGQRVFGITKVINPGDTIKNASLSWVDTTAYSFYFDSECGDIELGEGENYFGGRIIRGVDTSLFYVHIEVFSATPQHPQQSYRLVEYAIQGEDTAISIYTTINDLSNSACIKVYPNPFVDQINFTANEPTEFSIHDYMGRTVKGGVASGSIETSELEDGIYFLLIRQEGGSQLIKLLKQRN